MQDVHKSEININGSNQSIFLIHISSKFYFYTLYHKCLILKIKSLFPACGDQVRAILDTVKSLEKKKTAICTQLMDELAEHGVSLINFNTLSDDEGKILEAYFDRNIAPFLSPMIIGKQQPFPFLPSGELYAVVLLSNRNGKNRMGIVPCSNQIFKRLIEIPSRPGTFMLCEELILHFVTKLFSNYAVREKSVIRITRNADIEPT